MEGGGHATNSIELRLNDSIDWDKENFKSSMGNRPFPKAVRFTVSVRFPS